VHSQDFRLPRCQVRRWWFFLLIMFIALKHLLWNFTGSAIRIDRIRSNLVAEHSTLIRHQIDTDSTVTQHGNCNGMMRRNRRQTDTIYELTIESNDLFILPRFAVLCTTLQPFALLLIFRVFFRKFDQDSGIRIIRLKAHFASNADNSADWMPDSTLFFAIY